MKKFLIVICLITGISASNGQNFGNILNSVGSAVTNATNSTGQKLSNDEIIKGLKEALSIGTNNSTNLASKMDGFYKNPLIKIPYPPETNDMMSTLKNMGMGSQVDKFTETLNRAAEKAAKDAAPIFLNAITSMSISDGLSILKGSDNAATKFLQDKTTGELKIKFLPVVKKALQEVQITKYWNPLASKYNKLPLARKVNPNLDDYVTGRAIEGLFKLVAQEESKIRKDPAARVSDLLKKVFG